MNNIQLENLSKSLGDYPHEAIIMQTIPYHIIKCRQEKIPAEICRLLMDAPDFDGIMTWTSGKQITFTYKQ